MLLMSKDDNLLLLTGGLIFAILNSKDCIKEEVQSEAPELFTQSDFNDEEENKQNPYLALATSQGVVNSIIEVFKTEMPLRNFTLRLYARLLFKIKPSLDNIDEQIGVSNLTKH